MRPIATVEEKDDSHDEGDDGGGDVVAVELAEGFLAGGAIAGGESKR